MDDPAVKRKVILYPETRDLSYDDVKEAVEGVTGRVRGANPLGNGGWLLRMSNATEAIEVLQAAKKGKILIGGKRVSAQRPSQGQATDANRTPLGGASAAQQGRSGPFKKDRDNKRQRACTVVVAHVSPQVKDAVRRVKAEAAKVGEVKSVRGPLTQAEISEEEVSLSQIEGKKVGPGAASPGIILVEYGAVSHAFAAVKALHGSKVKGLPRPLWCRQLGGEGAKIKYWRIIVRNLPFKVDEAELRRHMGLKGELFVWDAHIPKGSDGRVRGFGFVGYICRSDAERAIKKLNGTKLLGRVIVLDWTVGKKEFQEGAKAKEPPAAEEGSDLEVFDDAGVEGETGSDDDDDEEEGDKEAETEGDAEGNPEEEAAMMQRIISSFQANSREEGQKGSRGEVAATTPGQRPQAQPKTKEEEEEAIGRTVFVSHVPLSAYKMDLQRVMEAFGQVSSCRMVMDKQTRKFSGKAFVEYAKAAGARRAAQAHADAKAGKREKLSVNGHLMNVYSALNRNGIQDLSDQIKKKTNRPDKRNLYLADEGYIDPQSGAGQGMSEGDQKARERSHSEKLEKLKNPNMFVSTTRLMIRNLPSDMTKGQLRALCVKAIRERATKARPKVTQCKIMYHENPNTKVLKSSERGFIEFTDHEHAICCLRMLNNNPNTFKRNRRPIVEFAIENTLALQKQRQRREREKAAAAEKKAEAKTKGGKREKRGSKEETEPDAEGGAKKKKRRKEGKGNGEAEDRPGGKDGGKRDKKSKLKPKPKGGEGATEKAGKRRQKRDTALEDQVKDEVKKRSRAKKAKKAEKVDKLDSLIEDYQAKYFNSELNL